MSESIQAVAGKVLGKKTDEIKAYNPGILVSIPRNLSIEYLGVKMEELPGTGFDTWYCYEFRTLTKNGLPIAALLKFTIPHSSKNIIESKSFKLYCNGFATERLGETKKDALLSACQIMKKDLSAAAGAVVEVSVVNVDKRERVFENYQELTSMVDPEIQISEYSENPGLLEFDNAEKKEYRLKFDALRSKCRITSQPDSGTVYLYYKSRRHITEDSLVRYFSSFYEECHFHEEILVAIFTRINAILEKDDELFVAALYQRRGSLDIAPCHYKNIQTGSQEGLISKSLQAAKTFAFDPNNLYR